MGTLDEARRELRWFRTTPVPPPVPGEKATRMTDRVKLISYVLRDVRAYQRGILDRIAGSHPHRVHAVGQAYRDELRDLEDVAHDLALLAPIVDTGGTVWRGRTRGRLIVEVVRTGQAAIGRQGRARVEDVYAVLVDGVDSGAGRLPRKAAMKQARWATMVSIDGDLPAIERLRIQGGLAMRRGERANRRRKRLITTTYSFVGDWPA